MHYPFDSRDSFESYVKDALQQFRTEIRLTCGEFDLEPVVAEAFSKYVEGMLVAFRNKGTGNALFMFEVLETNSRIMKAALAFQFDARLLTKFDRLVNNLSFGVGSLY